MSIGFDLNLPLDEYGAINFDFEENLAGKINFFWYDSMLVIKIVGLNLLVFFFLQLEDANEAPVEANGRRKAKDMTEELRKQVYQALLARS